MGHADIIKSGTDAAFPKDEYTKRQARLKRQLKRAGVDLYVTSGAENIFYLCGQQTPGYYTFQCLGIPASGPPFLLCRGLEAYNARANTYLADVTGYADDANPGDAVSDILIKRGYKRKAIAVDRNAWFLTVNLYERFSARLSKLRDGSGIVEGLRRVKSPRELAAIKKAAVANDAGMQAGLDQVRTGANENDIAAAVMQGMIAAGSEYVGMEPFVVSGPRSGLPHATWRRRKIGKRDIAVLETAACFNRYHAALFRTVGIGPVAGRTEEMYAVCREALDAATAKAVPGNTCADVHNAAQAVIDQAGYTDGFRKRSGYSIGISFAPDWGEGNILSLYHDVTVPVRSGMVFHIPITLREWGKFTVAISETVMVGDKSGKRLSRLTQDMTRV